MHHPQIIFITFSNRAKQIIFWHILFIIKNIYFNLFFLQSAIQYSSISCCLYSSIFSPRSYFSVEGLKISITKRGLLKNEFPRLLRKRQFIETSGMTVFSSPSIFHLYCTLSPNIRHMLSCIWLPTLIKKLEITIECSIYAPAIPVICKFKSIRLPAFHFATHSIPESYQNCYTLLFCVSPFISPHAAQSAILPNYKNKTLEQPMFRPSSVLSGWAIQL